MFSLGCNYKSEGAIISKSQINSVGIVTRLRAGRTRNCPYRLLVNQASNLVVRKGPFPGVKAARRGAVTHLLVFVNNVALFSTPTYVWMTWCLIRHRNQFICDWKVILCFCLGTYGTVFKAKNRETHEIVALKRVRLDDDDEVRPVLSFHNKKSSSSSEMNY